MEKSRRKIRECIEIILFIAIVIIMALIIVDNYNIYTNNKINNYILKTKLKALNNKYNNLINSNICINKRINEITNIDESISTTKDNVYRLASIVERKIQEGSTGYKIAYITFDDGPYFLTNNVLDVLRSKKVKATFFTIGLGKESCYDNNGVDCTVMYEKEAREGHVVANHTYSHAIRWGLYSSSDEFINQINIQDNLITSRTGVKPNIMRFPGGSYTAGGLREDIINRLRQIGYGWVDWTAQDGDGGNVSSKEEAWNNFVSTIDSNIEVVLFHDYHPITTQILPNFIDYLEENNYIILPLFYDSVMINK